MTAAGDEPEDGSSRRRWRRPRTWTLLNQLLASILALYLVVTLITGTATVLASRTSQLDQVDTSLTAAVAAITGDRGRSGGGAAPPPGVGLGQLTCTTDTGGEVLSLPRNWTSTDVRSACYLAGNDGARTELTHAQVTTLVGSTSATPTTHTVGGADFRVVRAERTAQVDGTDQRVIEVRGLPISSVQESVRRLIRTVLLVSLAGLVLVGAAAWLLVRRNLIPLRRVAATAQRVAHLPLAAGADRTQERVPSTDTDTRTEVGQVGAALNELLEHVDRSLDARHRSELQVRQFVADASHELRTPLASIRGYAELSRKEPQPVPDSVRHALGRIESESNRMTTLVEDLLLLARIDSGRPLERRPVDLTMLALETVGDARVAGPDHHWGLDLPPEPAESVGDEARLRQVLINLLSNARTHTPPGTTVTTRVRPVAAGVEISVADDGPGIPDELTRRVFERFTRGDSARTRTQGSTGLGLSIVEAIVSAHGGTVEVSSDPGRTIFVVRLPSTPTPPPGAAVPPAPPTDDRSK